MSTSEKQPERAYKSRPYNDQSHPHIGESPDGPKLEDEQGQADDSKGARAYIDEALYG